MCMRLTGKSHDDTSTSFMGLGIPVPTKILTMAIPSELQRQFARIPCHTPLGRILGSIESGERDKGDVQFDCVRPRSVAGGPIFSPAYSRAGRRGFDFSVRGKTY